MQPYQQHQRRAVNETTGKFLNNAMTGDTWDEDYAWRGTPDQFANAGLDGYDLVKPSTGAEFIERRR